MFGFYMGSVPAKGKRKGGAGGLNKLCSVSPELQVIVGQPAMPRTEVRMWLVSEPFYVPQIFFCLFECWN